jgi:hypothetical protein
MLSEARATGIPVIPVSVTPVAPAAVPAHAIIRIMPKNYLKNKVKDCCTNELLKFICNSPFFFTHKA